jgi:uncharacterized phiE125 gp8 family phage protein
MNIVQTIAPSQEPAALALPIAKQWMRVTFDEDDALITSILLDAREFVESYTNQSFVYRTYTLFANSFDEITRSRMAGRVPFPTMMFQGAIYLPYAPIFQINSIQYLVGQGELVTWDSSNYTASPPLSVPGWVAPNFAPQIFPIISFFSPNAVVIEYVTGYSSDGSLVPQSWYNAALMLASHWYNNRDASNSYDMSDVPFGVYAKLNSKMGYAGLVY